MTYPATSLLFAASDGRHRPASHPLLTGIRPDRLRTDPTPRDLAWHTAHGDLLYQRRVDAGWSRARLASALHVTRPAISYWEAGRYAPSPEHRAALERLLGEIRP